MESTQVFVGRGPQQRRFGAEPKLDERGSLASSAAQSNLGTSRLKALANGAWEGKRNDEKHEE